MPGDLDRMRHWLGVAEKAFQAAGADASYARAFAASGIAQAYAAAVAVTPAVAVMAANAPTPNSFGPAPKGFRCAAGCGHVAAIHRLGGCDVADCDCSAPYGRIMPGPDVPDDASELTP